MPDFGYGDPMTPEQIAHYFKVREAREEQGLPVLTDQVRWDRRAHPDCDAKVSPENLEGYDHPLLGMELYDTEEDREMVVDSVSNCWLDGFYIQMAVREKGTGSHALIFWENVNSESPSIIQGVERTRDRYEVIS